MELQIKLLRSAFTVFSLFLSLLIPIKSHAITFGQEVISASSSYPSVVSVWYAYDASDEFEPICTGTLIESRIVLTAAHCVLSKGIYAIGYGSDTLLTRKLASVSAVWKNPRYSKAQKVNDIGLLLTEAPLFGVQVSPLKSASFINSLVKNRKTKFEIVGWGKDQNDELASYLRKLYVDDMSSVMKKYFSWWRNDVWIGVGKYNKSERVFAGSCNGDSGGPLFAIVNGVRHQVGVTSWGAEDCEETYPSVYVRLSYYVNLINSVGIPTLLQNETSQNRALPSVTSEPRILGKVSAGETITCDPGKWSSNTTTVKITWSGSGVPFGYTGISITLAPNTSNYPKEYICTVTGSNSNGNLERKISVAQNPPPSSVSKPLISNMPKVASNSSTQISCNSGTFNYSFETVNEWWVSESSGSDLNNMFGIGTYTKIGIGSSINFDATMFKSWGGKYLFCKTVARGDGGTSSSFSIGVQIPSFQKPLVSSYPKIYGLTSYQSPAIGTEATCSGWSWSNKVSSESVAWYINSSNTFSGATLVQNGSSIVLSQNFLETNKSKYLLCAVTGMNDGGIQIIYETHYLYYYPSTVTTPTPNPTPSSSSTSIKPNVVQSFTGLIGDKGTTLTWSAPINNGAIITSYVVEKSDNYEPGPNGESVWRVAGTTASTSLLVAELNPCYSSYYRIRAFTGTQYSDYSQTLGASNSSRCNTVLGLVSISALKSVPNGFSFQIDGFDTSNFEWKVLVPLSPQGRYAQVSSTGLVSETAMTPGTTIRVFIFKINRISGEYVGVTVTQVTAGS